MHAIEKSPVTAGTSDPDPSGIAKRLTQSQHPRDSFHHIAGGRERLRHVEQRCIRQRAFPDLGGAMPNELAAEAMPK